MASQCTANEASLQPCQENTPCDRCSKTAETFVKAESSVAPELLVRLKCAKGCGSSRSWMLDLSVQDGSLTFRPFQSSGIAFQRIPCYWPAALEGSCPSSSAPVSSLLWQQNDSFRNHSFWKSQWLTSMAHVLYRGLVRFACIKHTFSV